MKESVTKENEIRIKSILRPQTSKFEIPQKGKKHLSIQSNQDNFITKREQDKKRQNLLFSKFDFMKDYMKKERKEFKIKMKNLNNINLLEKDIDNLYKWENLFNNFKPIDSYISIKKPIDKNEVGKEIDENQEYDSPILLVDLPESKMNLFFRRKNIHEKKANANKKNLNIRPMSMYSPREDNSCFYYSSTFSDYYKEDFKTFIEKIPILKAKLKINSGKLRKEIYNKNYGLNNKIKILEEKRKDKSIIFNKQHLIIAGKRKNPLPLVKSVFFQKYFPENNFSKNQNNVNELNSNKFWNELDVNNASNNYNYKFQNRLLLSYYDINDPSLALFNQKYNPNKNNKNITNNYKNFNNNTNNNIKVYQGKEVHLKKDKETQKNQQDIEKPIKKIKSKNAKIKIKLGLFDKSIGTNGTNQINSTNLKTRSLTTTNNNIKLTLNKDNKDIKLPEYKSPNSFPLKTNSDVGNISYNKIKKFIKEKQFLNKFNIDYTPIPQTTMSLKTDRTTTDKSDLELIWDSKKIKPKKNSSLFDSIYDNKFGQKFHYHWDKNGNLMSNRKNSKCNVIYFNKCIKTKFNKDLTNLKLNNDNNCFYPINAFNKGDIENYKMKNKKILGNQKDKESNKDINSNGNLSDKFFLYDFSLDE